MSAVVLLNSGTSQAVEKACMGDAYFENIGGCSPFEGSGTRSGGPS